MSWVVARLTRGASSRHPAVGHRRRGRHASTPSEASVAGRCPACGPPIRVHRPGSGCPAVWCPAVRCPVTWVVVRVWRSGRLVSTRPASTVWRPPVQRPAVWCPARLVSSPSGVQPSGVQPVRCPTRPVSSPSGVRPPSVRTRPSPPTYGGGVRDQVEAARSVTTGTGRGPCGCRAVGRLGRQLRRPGGGRCCRGRGGQ
jgi:hypothetical protein